MKLTKFLPLLAVAALLGSCDKTPTPTPTSSNEPADSSVSPDSSSLSSSLPSSSEQKPVLPTAWTDKELQSMATFLGDYVIPFPQGFSENYMVGTDTEQSSFAAWDETIGDLSASYERQLLDAGYTFDEENNDPNGSLGDGSYRLYVNVTAVEDASVYVQTQYDDEGFVLFAWINGAGESSETFPYEAIETYFYGSYNRIIDGNVIPSFEVTEGTPYYYLEHIAGVLNVYGAVSGTAEETEGAYGKSLTDLGYTLVSAEESETMLPYGYSADTGFLITYSYYEGSFDLYIEEYQSGGEATPVAPTIGDALNEIPAGTKSLSILESDIQKGPGYLEGAKSFEKDGVQLAYRSLLGTGGYVQFRTIAKGEQGALYNLTSLGSIASITVTAAKADYYGVLSCYFGNEAMSATPSSEQVVAHKQSDTVYCYVPEAGEASYFYLVNNDGTYASKNLSIVINYTLD